VFVLFFVRFERFVRLVIKLACLPSSFSSLDLGAKTYCQLLRHPPILGREAHEGRPRKKLNHEAHEAHEAHQEERN
jgi:hypothetical protein